MIYFLKSIGLLVLYGIVAMIVIMLVQYFSGKVYRYLKDKNGESSLIFKKIHEADSWNLFVVVIVIIGAWEYFS